MRTTLPADAGSERSPERGASALQRVCLLAILALSAWMNLYRIAESGYANNFYSAGVKSMLLSLHNFLFVSSDPNGLITIDKPPLALWLQAGSAKLFGFSPASLLVPEAVAGVLCVLVVYLALVKPFGRTAALMAALALAVFPAFVAVSRDNNPDALLILLLAVSCWLALLAIRSGRLWTLIACAFVVGLAFNTKTLEAYLAVPGIALAYVVGAPGTVGRRVLKLLAAGAVLAVVSLAWLVFVDLTPASHRPWVGSTANNSELSLTFEYNGFGRLEGEAGGPQEIPKKPGAYVPLARHAPPPRGGTSAQNGAASGNGATGGSRAPAGAASAQAGAGGRGGTLTHAPSAAGVAAAARSTPPKRPTVLPDGRDAKPIPFARGAGPLRLLEGVLGTQGGWFVPLALLGGLAIALLVWRSWREGDTGPPEAHAGASTPLGAEREGGVSATAVGGAGPRPTPAASAEALGRRGDGRLAALIVFGGWFLTEAVFLSVAKGIVHPYYTSEMAPGAAAMVGGGLAALAALTRKHRGWVALFALAALLTAVAQVSIFEENHSIEWLGPILLAATALATLAVFAARARPSAVWVTLAVLCVAPAIFAAATWEAPVNGTFPVAGPRGSAGYGGVDAQPEQVKDYRLLLRYLHSHHVHTRFSVLTVSSVVSSPLILMGSDAASLAGYSGTDPAVSAGRLAALVKDGQARYVMLGGPYASRGGNGATQAAAKVCAIVPPSEWGVPRLTEYSFTLLDCAGDEGALAAS